LGIRANGYVLAASAAANLFALALPLSRIQIYDRVIPHQNVATLIALAVMLGAAIAAELHLRAARERMLTHAAARWELDTSQRLHRGLMTGDLARLQRDGRGALMDRMRAVDAVRAHRSGPAAAAMLDLPFAALFLAVLAWIAWPIAAAVGLVVATALWASRRVTRTNEALSEQRSKLETRRSAFLLEALSGMAAIKGLAIAEPMKRRHERLCASAAALTEAISANALIAQGAAGAAGQATPVVAGAAGAMMVMAGSMSLGGMAACILLASRVVQPIMKLEGLVAGEMSTRRREADIRALVDLAVEEDDAPAQVETTGVRLERVAVRPELQGLTPLEAAFASDEAPEPPFIDDVDLHVPRGRMIGISGSTGSGKSALMSVLAGRLQPGEGQVRYLGEAGTPERRAISLLPQSPSLLEGTVLENLTRFRPDLHLDDALQLSAALGIDRFFARHPDGLSLAIKRGVESGMPASVAQSVCIVAGLVGRPDVILFDEANLMLDAEADARMLDVLLAMRPRAAIVVATQRPSWLRACDETYRLEGGRLQKERPIEDRMVVPDNLFADPTGDTGRAA